MIWIQWLLAKLSHNLANNKSCNLINSWGLLARVCPCYLDTCHCGLDVSSSMVDGGVVNCGACWKIVISCPYLLFKPTMVRDVSAVNIQVLISNNMVNSCRNRCF